MSRGRPWTEADDAKLCELWRASVSTGTIAKRLDREKNAIHQRVVILRKAGVDLPVRRITAKARWVTRRNLARAAG